MKFDIESASTRKKKKQKRQQQYLYIIMIALFSIAALILLVTFLFLQQGNKKERIPVNTPQPTIVKKSELKIFDESSDERPIAVMIDNAIGDEKQAGLQESYINYEMIVEGGLTRIMALYKDKNVSLIGPIRSSRHYFLDYALESDAIFVHYGWSPIAEKDTKKLNVSNINGITESEAFRRDSNAKAPHNVFTRLSYINNYIEKTNYNRSSGNWKLFNYSIEEKDLSETDYVPKEATRISLSYSDSEYRSYNYDSENKYYLRSQNGSAHIDRTSDSQLHYKNIIIQRVKNETIDSEGRQDLETTGSGSGYFITNGHFLPISWTKESRNSKTTYNYENGTEITLNDGNTFVQIVPINSKITIE